MNDVPSLAVQKRWLCEPLPRDVAQSIERLAAAPDVCQVAVMPDVHLSDDVCVGLAVATHKLIYPAAVGGDIGCGMAAVATTASADLLADEGPAAALLAKLPQVVPGLRHGRATAPSALPAEVSAAQLSEARLRKIAERDGRVQLGTLGRGNHFLEFQADQSGQLWIMLHSGSRGIGQAIAAHHVACAERFSQRRKLPFLDATLQEGAAYLADVEWAIGYAGQNRLAMLLATERLLGELFGVRLDWSTLIHANHNHVRAENHFGQSLFVHRKGALPAHCEMAGLIPGSMGSASFHVTGRGCAEALCSSSHGAGRALSRSAAAQKISTRQLQRELRGVWFPERQASRLVDEAPSAYKEIRAVMQAQRELTRIDRELRPLLCYKGI